MVSVHYSLSIIVCLELRRRKSSLAVLTFTHQLERDCVLLS